MGSFVAMVEPRSSVPILDHHADPSPWLIPSQYLLFPTPISLWMSLSTEEAQEMCSQSESSAVFSVWILCCLAVAMDQRDHGPIIKWYYFPSTNNEEIPCKITHMALVLMKFMVWFLSNSKIQVYKYICWKNVSDYLWVAYVVSWSVSEAPFLAWQIVRYMYYLLFLLCLPEE